MEQNRNKRSFGSIGELAAIKFLEKKGYEIISKNFRVGRLGEIDIIARENEYICFVEVKTRSNILFGMPSEAVNRKKQDNIIKLANIYMSRFNLHNRNIRFDIVEIIALRKGDELEIKDINVIKNAF